MLVLRLTSDPALAGAQTDDDFTIGAITGATVFLLLLGTLAGAMGGVVYSLVRIWLPRNLRPAIAGVFAAVAIGGLTIEPGGIDFTALEPLSLAVAMFIALPAAYGVATAWLVERAYSRGLKIPGALALVVVLLPPGLTGLAGILVLLVAAIAVAVVLAANRADLARGLVRSSLVAWVGRGAIALLFALAGVELYSDVTGVL
jgi:hypothetical protein